MQQKCQTVKKQHKNSEKYLNLLIMLRFKTVKYENNELFFMPFCRCFVYVLCFNKLIRYFLAILPFSQYFGFVCVPFERKIDTKLRNFNTISILCMIEIDPINFTLLFCIHYYSSFPFVSSERIFFASMIFHFAISKRFYYDCD